MRGLLFVVCCLADLFVLRTVWQEHRIIEGQFRRGYFEKLAGKIGLAMDDVVRPPIVPSFLLTDDGELAAPPGMITIAALKPGTAYQLRSDSKLAPYLVVGYDAPLDGASADAQLVEARTLSLQEGHLALVAWDPSLPWREDAARLTALGVACAGASESAAIEITAADGRIEVRFGSCSLTDSLLDASGRIPLLTALSGAEWIRIARRPGWIQERHVIWPVVGMVLVKLVTLWWALGLPSLVATSAVLAFASIPFPVPAVMTWPLMLLVAIASAAVRAVVAALRRLPPGRRLPAVLALAGLCIGLVTLVERQHQAAGPNWGDGSGGAHPCVMVGYSTVEDQGLRRERGGIRWMLNEDCDRCRSKTSSLSFGGATLGWARGAYCESAPSVGAEGQVIFLGGANDDFLSGVVSMARLFVLGRQGVEAWHRNQATAPAASLAHIDTQTEALNGLARCAIDRGARFLFLHDFVVTDLVAGRDPERATMLARRRDVVERAGGTFVDLYETFGAEAGISWFNDYVHPSRVAHGRIAQLACERLR